MDNETQTYLTKEEIKLLYEHLKYDYINYENIELTQLVRKISAIANDDMD